MKYLSKQNPSGYSLVELIIVLVLIGLITAAVVPFLMSTIDKTKLKTSAKEIAASLRYARNLAITTKKLHYFYIDLDRSSYWISLENLEIDHQGYFDQDNAVSTVGRIRTISKEIMIQKVEAGTSVTEDGIMIIPFFPQGNTIDTTVYLRKKVDANSNRNYEVHLDEVTGRVKIVKDFS